jgi:hypothetical protein
MQLLFAFSMWTADEIVAYRTIDGTINTHPCHFIPDMN